MSRKSLIWIVSIFAVALTGCGGTSSSDTTAPSTAAAASVPAAEFAKQADAVCTAENKKRDDGGPAPTFDPNNATAGQIKGAADYLANDLAVTEDEIAKLQALGEPQGKEKQFHSLTSILTGSIVPGFSNAVDAAKAGDTAKFKSSLISVEKASGAASKLAGDLGLKVCGS